MEEWDEVENRKKIESDAELGAREIAELHLKAEERKFLRGYENRNND